MTSSTDNQIIVNKYIGRAASYLEKSEEVAWRSSYSAVDGFYRDSNAGSTAPHTSGQRSASH